MIDRIFGARREDTSIRRIPGDAVGVSAFSRSAYREKRRCDEVCRAGELKPSD